MCFFYVTVPKNANTFKLLLLLKSLTQILMLLIKNKTDFWRTSKWRIILI